MKKIISFVLVSVLFFLAGCQSHDPLSKLKSDTLYSELNNPFWAKEKDKHSDVWLQALTYCKTHEEKPNCGVVMEVFVISNGNTTFIPIGSSKNKLVMPNF